MKIRGLIVVFFVLTGEALYAQCPGVDSFSVSMPRCIHSPITFINVSTDIPLQSVWKFGDGTQINTPGNNTSIAHTYDISGSYSITLVNIYQNCTDSSVYTITIDDFPSASFSYSQPNACASAPVSFNNTSVGAFTYLWHFGDLPPNDTSTAMHPVYAFHSVGTGQQNFTVELTAISAQGCIAQTSLPITVQQVPDASLEDASGNHFSGCDVSNLSLTVVNASSTMADNVHYHLNWGNGSPDYDASTFTSASTVYNSQGMFPITFGVTGSNGCVATQVYHAFNGSNPSIGLSTPGSTIGLCGPITIQFPLSNFNNNPPGTIYTIITNDGSPNIVYNHPPPSLITHTFNRSSCGYVGLGGSVNSFYLRVIASNPCGESMVTVEPIRVSEKPVVNFTAPPVACLNQPYTLNSQLINGTSVSNQGVCNSTLSQLSFRYWSIEPSSGWTTSSNLQNSNSVNIKFLQPDTYTVTFVGGTTCGRDTVVKTICVTGPPAPSFALSTETGCAPFMVNAQNTTLPAVCGNVTSLWSVTPIQSVCEPILPSWTFDSATTIQSLEPVLQFNSAGKYRVALTMTNTCGTRIHADTVSVKTVPLLSLPPVASGCGELSVSPSLTVDACLGSGALIYAWESTGGMPAFSSNSNQGSILYNQSGHYSISVTVANECGMSDTSIQFFVYPIPTASAGSDISVCTGDTAMIGSQTSGLTYQWTPSQFLLNPGSAQTSIVGTNPSNNTVVQSYILSVADSHCVDTDTVLVNIYPAPPLPIVQGDTICEGHQAQLGAWGSGTIIWYDTPSGGMPLDTGNLFISPILLSTQTYYVEHIVGNCVSLSRQAVIAQVNALPNVSAGPDLTVCNQPVGVQLAGLPSGGVWLGSQVSALGVFAAGNLGVFENIYQFTDMYGCSDFDTIWVTVVSPVIPTVQADTNVCRGGPAFTLAAAPAGGSWVGGGVTPLGVFSPTVTGVYPLVYTYGSGNCAARDTMWVTVIGQPAVEAGNPLMVCANISPFTLAGNSPLGGTWDGEGIIDDSLGTFDPSMMPGQYMVTYTVYGTNGCPASDTNYITVHPLPIVNAGSDMQVCSQAIPVSLTATPSGGFWTGSGITSGGVFMPSVTGIFTFSYIYTDANGCNGYDTLAITVIDAPVVSIPNDTALCQGSSAFLLSASPAGGTWTGYNITAAGWFNPALGGTFAPIYTVGVGSCQVSDTMSITVHSLPVVYAGNDTTVCGVGQPFLLTGNLPAGGTWSGAGISNPITGLYDVSLGGLGVWPVIYTYIDANHCSQSDVLSVQVLPLPDANFTIDTPVCTGASILFSPNINNTWFYNWSFGDGATSTLQAPYHVYSTEGSVMLQLIVSAGIGCSDTVQQNLEVMGSPQADISASSLAGCGPLNISVETDPGNNTTYFWNLGNGNTSSLAAPGNVLYPAPVLSDTTYVITLTATNACGSEQATQPILVYAEPWVVLGTNINTGCSPLNVQFTQSNNGSANSVFWDFGDGHTSSSPNPVAHTFVTGTNDTLYTVMLIIHTDCGSDTAYTDIHILPNTVHAFFNTHPISGCPPLEVNFTNFSTGGTSNVWSFGDGNTSNLSSPTYIYQTPGNYTAQLAVNNGCSYDTAEINITVLNFPSLGFSVLNNIICENQPITFVNNSTDVSGSSWSFGDGSFSTVSNPTHVYASAGIFMVSLTGTSNSEGCSGTVSTTVTVNVSPILDIGFPQGVFCSPYSAEFTNNSSQVNYYTWNFGDGNTGAGPNPIHNFLSEGTHTITVVGENLSGCKDTATGHVQILPSPQAAFVSSTVGCVPIQWAIDNQTTGAIGYVWDFGNGTTSTLNEPTVLYDTPGTYTIHLYTSNAYGCSDTAQQEVNIYATPTAAMGNQTNVCAGNVTQFVNHSSGADSYIWHMGDGSISTDFAPVYVYNNPGIYEISLVASNPGCSDTAYGISPITIFQLPVAYFVVRPDTVLTTNPVIHLLSDQPQQNTCIYYLPNGNTIHSCISQATLSDVPSGSHSILFVLTNEFGCQDSAWHSIFMIEGTTLYVPNAFTPNADGENDIFYAYGLGIKSFELIIMDRWGNEIYKSNDIKQGWNGQNKIGQTVKQDVYIWQIQGRDIHDEPIKIDGRVTVIY